MNPCKGFKFVLKIFLSSLGRSTCLEPVDRYKKITQSIEIYSITIEIRFVIPSCHKGYFYIKGNSKEILSEI